MDYNKIFLIGHVDSEPILERHPETEPSARFKLATYIRLGSSGRTDVHYVIANGAKQAEYCSHLHKDDEVLVEGWLRYYLYEGNRTAEVMANVVKKPPPPAEERVLYRGGERSRDW